MNNLAWITVVTQHANESDEGLPLTSRVPCLVLAESFDACTLVLRATPCVVAKAKCVVELGALATTGVIRRVKEIHPGLQKADVQIMVVAGSV